MKLIKIDGMVISLYKFKNTPMGSTITFINGVLPPSNTTSPFGDLEYPKSTRFKRWHHHCTAKFDLFL